MIYRFKDKTLKIETDKKMKLSLKIQSTNKFKASKKKFHKKDCLQRDYY